MSSTMKIFGLNHIHENTSIEFTDTGIRMASGINIKPEVVPLLVGLPGQVFKGEFMYIYRRFMHVPAEFINKSTIINVQKTLLTYAQNDVKKVKR